MVDVTPATAPTNALVGDVLVHKEEHLLKLVLVGILYSVVVSDSYTLHEGEVVGHLISSACEDVLVPRRDHTLVSLGMTHKPYSLTSDNTLLLADAILGKLGANLVHLLRIKLGRCVDNIAETLFDNLYLCTMLIGKRCKLDIWLDVVELSYLQPVVG